MSASGSLTEKMAEEDFQEILRIQQLMSQRLMQEQRVDHKIDLLNIITELTEQGTKRTQTEAVLIEAQLANLGEREVMQILVDLEQDRLIRRQGSYIERT